MKCEIIWDLLPLYIEGLTNQTTAEEMERHLKKCGKCRQYYKEMTDKLPDILPKAETDSVKLLKKGAEKKAKDPCCDRSPLFFALHGCSGSDAKRYQL